MTSAPIHNRYEKYRKMLTEIADLEKIIALMQWDQEVNMPSAANAFRARQISRMAAQHHEMAVSEDYYDVLASLLDDDTLNNHQQMNVQRSMEDYQQEKRLPSEFVVRLSEAVAKSHQGWVDAQKENNFRLLEPHLEQIVALKREQAQLLGYKDHPYDALLNNYEKGLTVVELDEVFTGLKHQLGKLLDEIRGARATAPPSLKMVFPRQKQLDLCRVIASEFGFDFSRGRLDLSAHPFSLDLNPRDVRITTRIQEEDLMESLSSVIHEVGHGLYGQGLSLKEYGLPGGEAASLSIHESQSRLWENQVGRSEAFVNGYYQLISNYFPEVLKDISAFDFFRAINQVRPSFIRTSADEITYHFHILIRYELEKELISGAMEVSYLPQGWKEKYQKYLGLEVPDDNRGVLQDLHWAHGDIGYFPTYSLGSLYGAQFYAAAEKAIPDLDEHIRHKHYKPLLKWLKKNIFAHGRLFTSKELCEQVTGEPLNYKYFDEYARKKYRIVYGIK
ncbi:MAG: carboxypeptidase M32 [Bacteroidia bacterium]